MKIVLAGGTGFLGQSLIRHFPEKADWVVLSRKLVANSEIKCVYWDGASLGSWIDELEGADILINLSGKSVDCRYNEKNRNLIYSSRLNSTRILGGALKKLQKPPHLWINAASATYYRHAMDGPQDEITGEAGSGFSVDVCKQWEQTFFGFQMPGVRQVAIRTAIVLGKNGGVMHPFRNLAVYGLGGKMGSGDQMFSWLHETDFARAIHFIILNKTLTGPVNLSSPNPVTNEKFMRELRKSLGVNFGIPTPVWLLELGALMIRTETELILKSRWVLPGKILKQGYDFSFSDIGSALKELNSKV